MIACRAEAPNEHEAVLALNRRAFGGDEEAILIDRLAGDGLVLLSSVAADARELFGHILFSKLDVEVDGRRVAAAALAPMAVEPRHQRRGIGSDLVRHGLGEIAKHGLAAVIVLGHKDFYPRFGFSAELARHLASPFQGDPHFMAIELKSGALAGRAGVCRYPAAFGL